VSNSPGLEIWVRSPVCMIRSGTAGSELILSMAACRVAGTSGFASLLKPMWLSLICTKLNPASWCPSWFVAPNSRDVGIPPDSVQTNPVPAQAMHFKKPLRAKPSWLGPSSIESRLRLSSAIVLLLVLSHVAGLPAVCVTTEQDAACHRRSYLASPLLTSETDSYSKNLRCFPRSRSDAHATGQGVGASDCRTHW
jgi:hypothetical protein